MRMAPDLNQPLASTPVGIRELLSLCLWFGFFVGLAEGLGFLVAMRPTWLPASNTLFELLLPQLVMSLSVYSALYLILGLLLAVPVCLVRWKQWPAVIMGCAVFVAAFTALEFTDRLRLRASLLLALGVAVQTARLYQRRRAGWQRFQRKSLPILAVLVLLILTGSTLGKQLWQSALRGGLPDAPAGAPNVVLIVWDTVRAESLSAYGYSRRTTPFLESFAKEGVLFTRAYSASSWTVPSHISLFSNRRPREHAVRTSWGEIRAADPRYPLLAEVLSQNGYATAGFPGNYGNCAPKHGFGRGFEVYVNPLYRPYFFHRWITWRDRIGTKLFSWGVKLRPEHLSAEDIRSGFLSWLDGVQGRPFFVFLNYYEAHQPFYPDDEELQRFATDPDRVRNRKPLMFTSHEGPLSPGDLELEREAYDASIATLDKRLAELFNDLRQRGLDKNTLIILTSDHGTLNGEHGMIGHRNALYHQQVHVPLVIWYPSKIPAGLRVNAPVGNWLLPATILQLAGIEDRTPVFSSGALTESWTSDAWQPSPIAVEVDRSEGGPASWLTGKGWIRSLITTRWQLIVGETGDIQLFDLQNDPAGLQDLAGKPELQPTSEELRRQLDLLFQPTR